MFSALGAFPVSANDFTTDTQARLAAEALAIWGLENDADLALLSGLSGLLAAGVSLDPADPWNAHHYANTLRQRFVANERLMSHLSVQLAHSRGVFDGISRIDAVLEPSENMTVTVQMVKGETALVEARIKNDGKAADIDLIVKSLGGDILASDIGPETGIEGTGTFVQWVPKICETVNITVTNAGNVAARFVIMAPPSRQEDCDPTRNQ